MNRSVALAIVVLLLACTSGYRALSIAALAPPKHIVTGLVYDPNTWGAHASILKAYEAFFEDNGIPYMEVPSTDLALKRPEELAATFPALVFGDALNGWIPTSIARLMQRYAGLGGAVAFINDVGTRSNSGTFLPRAATADVAGIDYGRYSNDTEHAFYHGPFTFSSGAAERRWEAPFGKLTPSCEFASYKYGPLVYPLSRTLLLAPDVRVDGTSGSSPQLTVRRFGRGTVLWVGLPLGYLKANSDAFPMQTILAHFLLETAGMPHLVPSPGGVGRLIINLHLDSNSEWPSIPHLIAGRLVRRSIAMEFDVTAGPDRDRVGDHAGLDACGLGAPLIRELRDYGAIGSHGGWAHNYFAWGVENETLNESQITHMIKQNNDCLSRITGGPIRSFAAPDGAHPQPMMTNIIKKLGMNSYYYTGDTGMPATRPFSDGRMVSDRAWAFPVMPDDRAASLAELSIENKTPESVGKWLLDTADHAVRKRSVMLLYSHGYDLLIVDKYDAPFTRFLDHVERLQRAGALTTGGMADSATFLQRFVLTNYAFAHGPRGEIAVHLENAGGLHDIAFTAPRGFAVDRVPPWLAQRGNDHGGHTYAVTDDRVAADVTLVAAP